MRSPSTGPTRTLHPGPSRSLEAAAEARGAKRIAGIDEAGRGPLAGPVVAAAVVLSPDCTIPGLNDSKRVSASAREKLFESIERHALSVAVGMVPPHVIDEINILQATRRAMALAISQLTPPPDHLLIDGPIRLDLEISQEGIVKGDQLSVSIAAASIVAKVTRDRIMMDLHRRYPEYGFDRHKGYGTQAHRQALQRLGPSPVHRMCFKGVCA